VEKAPIAKPTPKKREQPVKVIPEVKVAEKPKPKASVVVKPEIKEDDLINPEIAIAEYKRARAKPSNDKYVRYASSEYLKNKNIISEKVQKNEMKFAYFAIDGDDFYHYYILTK
jgi:hypothetical protein